MEKLSRIVMAFEALLLAAPSTWLVLWLGHVSLGSGNPGDQTLLMLLVLLVVPALASGWILLIGFVFAGRRWLARRSGAWLLALPPGCAAVLIGLLQQARPGIPSATDPLYELLAFGAPLMVPALHLYFERSIARASARP